MSDTVWISTAMAHASNLRPMTHSFSAEENLMERARGCRDRNDEGEPLGPDCFPQEVFGALNAKEADYKLPNLFFAGSYWVVSAAAAKVLRAFDLGEGSLYPVQVFKRDRETPIGDEWFCINFGNRKSALIPEKSSSIRQRAQGRYRAIGVLKEGEISVSTAAIDGPDLWIESRMWDALFLSDALAKALKKEKVDRGFYLTKCKVLSD